jgi:phosphatidylethanolamine-binding protein (PEBP) family uncharacterized protein
METRMLNRSARTVALLTTFSMSFVLVSCLGGGNDGTGGAGTNGSGSAGTTGAAGTTAAAGTTGSSAGTNGAAGTSAAAGTTGTTTGTAGSNATAGTNGAAGTSAAAGTNGAAGTNAAAGTSGGAGTTGSGGRGGTTGNAGAGGTTGGGGRGGAAGGTTGTGGTGSGTFSLTSPDHMDGAKFATMYTCAMMNGQFGSGVLPELNWTGAPAGTMSFAITFIDTTIGENSAMGQHWAIWNIPATVSRIPRGTKALSGELMTARQNGNYLAPCAQSLVNNMDDQYEFTIYALSGATLNVSGTSVANALTALRAVTPLATAKLRGHAGLRGM